MEDGQSVNVRIYIVTLVHPVFCSCDLDLDSMTLTNELD